MEENLKLIFIEFITKSNKEVRGLAYDTKILITRIFYHKIIKVYLLTLWSWFENLQVYEVKGMNRLDELLFDSTVKFQVQLLFFVPLIEVKDNFEIC